MENPAHARGVRRVRCPRCHSVLEEPAAPVYQCGGCNATLRAKIRTGDASAAGAPNASPSRSGLPPQSGHLDSTDVASTSRSSTPTPDVTSSWHPATDTTRRHGSGDAAGTSSSTPDATGSRRQAGRRESGDVLSAGRHGSGDVASTSSTPDAGASARQRDTGTASRRASPDPVPARKHDSGDVASTSGSTPEATISSRNQGIGTRSRRESGDFVSVRTRIAELNRGHDQSADRCVSDSSEARRRRGANDAAEDSAATAPGASVHFSQDAAEVQDGSEKRRKKDQAELPEAERMQHSGEAAGANRKEAAQSAGDVLRREDDDVTAAGAKAPTSPPHHELQPENLAPLRERILKTVDELKGDLSELFSKSPDLNPAARGRPPRLPRQEDREPRAAAAAPSVPARARHAAVDHRGRAARAPRPAGHQVAVAPPPRGLPSRRYRRCRADSCCHNAQPVSCHHGCCRHHGKPECSSCRGHCCRPRGPHAHEPSAPPRKPPPAAKEAKRRQAPRNHCRPVLKGAPFIVCSSCFQLVQVPADFAISTKAVRKLRCGSCSAVLSYSYRDPGRKKAYQDSVDGLSTDGSQVRPDPFAPFVDGFGLSSYSTEDERPLPVSRNTSFDTTDGAKGVGRLHWLMGYGSASELLRHSPDLYESFSERTTPDVGVGHYDRKGKGVYIDDNDYDVDDSDEEDAAGVLKRSAARGSGMLPAPGAFRIKS